MEDRERQVARESHGLVLGVERLNFDAPCRFVRLAGSNSDWSLEWLGLS
jgi:hypothetical protein